MQDEVNGDNEAIQASIISSSSVNPSLAITLSNCPIYFKAPDSATLWNGSS